MHIAQWCIFCPVLIFGFRIRYWLKQRVQETCKFFLFHTHPIVCALVYFDLKIKSLLGAHCIVMNFINFLSGSDFRSDLVFTEVNKIDKLFVEIWWEKSCWKIWNSNGQKSDNLHHCALQSGTPDNIVSLCCCFYVYTFLRHYKIQTKKKN